MLLLVIVWNAGWVFAEKRARFRLTTPIAAEYGDIEGATNITEQGSGYGMEYIVSNGFGLGWSTYTAKAKFDLTLGSTDLSFDQETDAQFLDLTYLFGDSLTLQVIRNYIIRAMLANFGHLVIKRYLFRRSWSVFNLSKKKLI